MAVIRVIGQKTEAKRTLQQRGRACDALSAENEFPSHRGNAHDNMKLAGFKILFNLAKKYT